MVLIGCVYEVDEWGGDVVDLEEMYFGELRGLEEGEERFADKRGD